MTERISRRSFLASSLAGSFSIASCRFTSSRDSLFPGEIRGASHHIGHLLRTANTAVSPPPEKADVIVAGGGIAGLIAAHRLRQAGRNVLVLDLESHVGGNSAAGENSVSRHPWGAHYVPVPSPDMTDVCSLFAEFGLGAPGAWNERHLCHDPTERLFLRGTWQDGIIPRYGLDPAALAEIERFFARMEKFKNATGNDGKRAFAIPAPTSSTDHRFTELDSLTMADWLDRENFHHPDLRWYINYACRDDYGADATIVSAWAGIHYFASRDSHEVFTWPEGNGWIVKQLATKLANHILTGQLVTAITPDGQVTAIDAAIGTLRSWQANAVVCAMPLFIAARIVKSFPVSSLPEYSPWLVANLTVATPVSQHWDNVLRDSRGLGYVVATHQNLHPVPGASVLTYYRPLDHLPPAAARVEALRKSHADWSDEILADLHAAHPDLATQITRLDVWLWGHAMARPAPGFLTHKTRLAARSTLGRIHFAHSDLSGIPIFEEACHWGHEAARTILT